MKKLIIILALAISGCTDASKATKVLNNNGFTDVEITGYRFLVCSDDDLYSTGFVATAPNGNKVKGSVCAGLFFKGSTIRYD